jgi:ABC-type uncharacterized transport system permease subunit
MILASAFPLSMILAATAAGAYLVPALASSRISPGVARRLFLLAWGLHAVVLAWGLMLGEPRFGFAPALSVTAWLVAAVYLVESHFFPQLQTRWALCALGSLAVLLALFFPGSALHASASPWLPLHWALGIASYGLFGAAVAHAWFMTRTEERIRLATDPHSGMPLLTIERLTFRFVEAGFILLSASLLVVLLFGESLYGAQAVWKWNHKTVFSVLSWVTFAVLLIGRSQLGWRGRRAVRVLYIGSGFLLLAYVGSRFVAEVILGRSL